jgi:putative ABC transport system substrate-binding protein
MARAGSRRTTLGWTEGENFAAERRYAEDQPERFADLAGDLARLAVDVIVVEGTPTGQAAQQATTTIPIVLAGSGDPVGVGLVASLSRPGANITGLAVRTPNCHRSSSSCSKTSSPR